MRLLYPEDINLVCIHRRNSNCCFTQAKSLVPRTKLTNLRLQTSASWALSPQQQCWSNNTPVYCCSHLTQNSPCWSCQALAPVIPLEETMEGHGRGETTLDGLNISPITCSTSLFLHDPHVFYNTSKHHFPAETWGSYQGFHVHWVTQNTSRTDPVLPEVNISLNFNFQFSSLVIMYVFKNYWVRLWNLLYCSLVPSVPKQEQFFLVVNIKQTLSLLVCWDFRRIFALKNSFQDCFLSFFPGIWKQLVDLQEIDGTYQTREKSSLESLLGRKKPQICFCFSKNQLCCSCIKLWWNTL